MCRALHSTLMLCPSYSEGKFAFDISAPAELECGCYTLWCNTCTAVKEEPPSYVGLIAAPNQEMIYRFIPECGGQCGCADSPCLFLAEIERTDMSPKINLYPHIRPVEQS